MIVVVVMIVPIVVGMPAVLVLIPPAMIRIPAVLASFPQFVTSVLSLLAFPAVVFGSLVQFMVGPGDSLLAFMLVGASARRGGEEQKSAR
jgi:hypothetical protein